MNDKLWFLGCAVGRPREQTGESHDHAFRFLGGCREFYARSLTHFLAMPYETLAGLGGGEGLGKLLFSPFEILSTAFAWDWMLDKGLLAVDSSGGVCLPHLPDMPLTFHLGSKILPRRFTGLRILVVTQIQCLRQLLSHPRSLPNTPKAFFLLSSDLFTVWTNDTLASIHAGRTLSHPQVGLYTWSEWYYHPLWLADGRTRVKMREL